MDIARRVCVCVCMFEGAFCVLPRPAAMLDQVHGGCDAGSPQFRTLPNIARYLSQFRCSPNIAAQYFVAFGFEYLPFPRRC